MMSGEKKAAPGCQKKKKGRKILLMILAALAVFFTVINLIPPSRVMEENPFLKEKNELPMIAAHRGGGVSNPEMYVVKGDSNIA